MKVLIHIELIGVPPQGTKEQRISKQLVIERDVQDWDRFAMNVMGLVGHDAPHMVREGMEKFMQLMDPPATPVATTAPAQNDPPTTPAA